MHDLTPHQQKLLHTLKSGPWAVGLAEMADDAFTNLIDRQLAVVRSHRNGPRAELTEAGWKVA